MNLNNGIQGAGKGAAFGSIVPGVGTLAGGAIGLGIGLLGNSLFGGGADKAPESDSRKRLQDFMATMSPGETNPFETVGYQGQMGSVMDALEGMADDDAGRSMAMGLSPGMAIASGAGARSGALADAQRGAAADSQNKVDADQTRRMQLMMQALGLDAQLEDGERSRADAARGRKLNAITQFATVGAGIGADMLLRPKTN